MPEQITITLNGQQKSLSTVSICALLEEFGFSASFLAIAINNEVIPKSSYQDYTLKNGDHVEIVAPSSGG